MRWTLLLISLGLVWGATIPLNKLAVESAHSPVGLVFWQQLTGFALLLGWYGFDFLTGKRKTIRLNWKLLIIVATLGTLLPHGLSFVAVGLVPANMASIGIAVTPMAAYLIALVLGCEVFSIRRSFGLILGAIAILMLLSISLSMFGQQAAWGIAIALLPGICYAAESNVIAAQVREEFDPIETLLFASGMACLVTVFLAWTLDLEPIKPTLQSLPFAALIASGVLHVLCYAAYFSIVSKTGAVFASQVAYFVTIGGFLSGTLFLKESAPPLLLVSLLSMVLGVGLVQPKLKKEEGQYAI